ncbi:MAG TPA: hypothetical protein VFG69_04990 [Nannocystaceae bacterium]|nr:hypothetical protein [Nannocystaceae bacterium]
MLEVHDVVPRSQGERIDAPADVPPRATDAPLATKDLVVGEDAQTAIAVARWQEEAATERADDERRRRGVARVFVEQFVEPLALPLVVAENDRWDVVAHDAPETLDVAVDGLRGAKGEHHLRLLGGRIDEPHRAEFGERGAGALGRLEQLFARVDLFTAAARELDVVRGLLPRALQLGEEMGPRREDEERVGREERGDREPFARCGVLAHLTVDGKYDRELDFARRALRGEVEVPEIDDLVAPELHAHGIGHPEGIDVEDPAAEAELCHVLDHRHALETDALEMLGQLARTSHVAAAKLDAQVGERPRKPSALEQRAWRREQNADLAAAQPLERLDALARDLDVGLGFAESLARGIERDRRLVEQGVQIGEKPLGLRHAVGDDDDEPGRQPAGERGDERRIG